MRYSETKRKYWHKQKAETRKATPGKNTIERSPTNELSVLSIWRSRRMTSARSFGCVLSWSSFFIPYSPQQRERLGMAPHYAEKMKAEAPTPRMIQRLSLGA